LSAPDAAVQMPMVEVSWGELVDKLTILEIKAERLTAPTAVANVRKELTALQSVLQRLQPRPAELDALKAQLKSVNQSLWDVEDQIRAKEAAQSFDRGFIELARAVYFNNDQRARLKREINVLLKSELVEEKQYTDYSPR
jgi:predicted  nucleic acid-binding Zn-ribbon protein